MVDLSELAKQLQEQVDVITKYLAKEKLPSPSFVPEGDPLKSPMASLPADVEKARKKAHSLSWNINQLLTPPVSHLMWVAFEFYEPVALRVIIEKRIYNMIPVDSPGVPISELATKSGIPENRLIHLLRQLTAINIFRETSARHFAHTTSSAILVDPDFSNAVDLMTHFLDEGYKSAGYLPEALEKWADKFDTVQKPELRTAFNLAFNTDSHYFDWIYTPENIPKYGDRFGRSMMGGARHEIIEATLKTYDWSVFKEGDEIVDVGGGVGHVGVAVARRVKPGVKIIVQDRPSVVEQGKGIHGHIVELQPHNFFDEQPIKGAKVYYLRLILHDWPDEVCRTILKNIVPAMSSESKLLILDGVWKEDEYWVNGNSDKEIIEHWDAIKQHHGVRTLHMMNKLGAKERTEREWKELFESVGLKLTNIYGRDNMHAIIEAVKA